MDYSITLEKFIDRINLCILDEISAGMNFGHVNYSAYIDSESLLEATNSCSDEKEQICNNIKRIITNKLKENSRIEVFSVDKVELIVKPQMDLTGEFLLAEEKAKVDKYRKYIQVKIGFKKKVNKDKFRYLPLDRVPEDIFANVESEETATVLRRYLCEHGYKFPSVNELIIFIFNHFKDELHLEMKRDVKILPIKHGVVEDKDGKDIGIYYELEKIYGVYVGTDGKIEKMIGYAVPME